MYAFSVVCHICCIETMILVTIILDFCRPLEDYYYPDAHFLNAEFENTEGSWGRATPGYFGFGYANLLPDVTLPLLLICIHIVLLW